jgi:hypothetical protein
MPTSRRWFAAFTTFRWFAAAAALSAAPFGALRAQEIGVYAGGGVGGIRDVRRPFGGGGEATFLFHDWIGLRGNAGYYWTLEHRLTSDCHRGSGEAIICTSNRLASRSNFPQLEGLLIVRGHIPGKGIRVEAGVGPTWLRVSNEIRAQNDTIYSPRLTSSAVGAAFFGGVLIHPPWSLPLELEPAYVYHMTGRFGACTGKQNDPLCDQRLHFHELRLSLFYRPRLAVK